MSHTIEFFNESVEAEIMARPVSVRASFARIAERMEVSQPVIARIEGSTGNRKHAPSLATLRRYAEACEQRLVIRFEPKEKHHA